MSNTTPLNETDKAIKILKTLAEVWAHQNNVKITRLEITKKDSDSDSILIINE